MASGTELTHGPTAGEYIAHHLTFLNNSGEMQANLIDFGLFNVDTLFYSITLGLLVLFILHRAASKATSGVPGDSRPLSKSSSKWLRIRPRA
jgi:F-type H+-transporting ATPase subunit a